ncbi:Zinc finger CCCH domain-containing protein 33 [Galdieria sulphuraria]|uniref:Tetratricopeptide repeat (TPR)-containing protein n=1 Tax=Galdieria sulphuraria TaxID=130081 RepID=M2Y8Q6_GALSU|nr:tetratricopeptide repeat (TPR)-containing protein [Galdieria sulphuraria]EME32224.1 tetratricopeptide repeat (TPR)-containing protein [Galdieria sulphuraria]GJD09646.1 Zinc finger CCCH domain-containing protein 33 [Galdieria sulphuraria]|eukprot:XP_005708744.1 tetratricopeptide repeat (TPR)-containing protein [Galdieria sulphuraria]
MLRLENLEKDFGSFEKTQKNGSIASSRVPLQEQEKAKDISLKEQGNNFFRSGRYHHATEAYTQALELADPNDYVSRTILLSNRSQCLLALQKYNLAVEDCTKALEYMPTHSKSYFRRGQALELLGHYEAALNDYQVAAKLEPKALEVTACVDRLKTYQSLSVRKEERVRKEQERRIREKERRRMKKEKESMRKKGFEEFHSPDVGSCCDLNNDMAIRNLVEKSSSVARDAEDSVCDILMRESQTNSDGLGSLNCNTARDLCKESYNWGIAYNEFVPAHTSTSSSWSSVLSVSGAEDENRRYSSLTYSSGENVSSSQRTLNSSSKVGTMGSASDERAEYITYPVRLNSPDCMYYLKTGKCNYGSRCKFNHPPRDERLIKALSRRDCFDFLQFGRCPYGKSCKYNHPSKAELNELGFQKDESIYYNSKSEVIENNSQQLNTRCQDAVDLEKLQKNSRLELGLYYLNEGRNDTSGKDFSSTKSYSGVDQSSLFNSFQSISTRVRQLDMQQSPYSYENTDPLRHSDLKNSSSTFPTDISLDNSSKSISLFRGYETTDLLDIDVQSSLADLNQEVDALSLENSESSLSLSHPNGAKSLSPQSVTPVKKNNWSPSVELASPRFSLENSSPLLGGFPSVWRLEPSEHVPCDRKNESLRQFSSSSLSSFETGTNDSTSGLSSFSNLASFSYLQGSSQDSALFQRRSPLERASLGSNNGSVGEVSSSFSNTFWTSPVSRFWDNKQ